MDKTRDKVFRRKGKLLCPSNIYISHSNKHNTTITN